MTLKTALISNMHVRIILFSVNTDCMFILYAVILFLSSFIKNQLIINSCVSTNFDLLQRNIVTLVFIIQPGEEFYLH